MNSVHRRAAMIAVAAVAALTLGACTAPSGPPGPEPVPGCFDSIGVGSAKIERERNILTGGNIYYWTSYGSRNCVPTGSQTRVQIFRSGDPGAADRACQRIRGEDGRAVFVGKLLVPSQPEVYQCFTNVVD